MAQMARPTSISSVVSSCSSKKPRPTVWLQMSVSSGRAPSPASASGQISSETVEAELHAPLVRALGGNFDIVDGRAWFGDGFAAHLQRFQVKLAALCDVPA